MTNALTAVRAVAIGVTLFAFCWAAEAQTAPIAIVHDTSVSQMTSDQFTWIDGGGQPRVAVIAHDTTGVSNPGNGQVYGLALREFRYQTPFGQRVAGVTTYGNGGYGGFGYVVEHSAAGTCVGDDSPLSDYFPPSGFQRVFEGRHHVIFRLTQNYQRNCPNQTRTIPVTMDWIFSTGRDNPIYAINYDVDLAGPNAPAGTFFDDSRAPYGELNIDGPGARNIDGVGWGDRYKFTSTAAGNVDLTSGWTYNTANTVPYVKEWINGPQNADGSADATMGLVLTRTLDQQDAGGARDSAASPNNVDIRGLWTSTSGAFGNACPAVAGIHTAYLMPCPDDWAYQANGDSLWGGPNNNARMTWKTMYGFVGPTTYNSNNVTGAAGATPPGYPKNGYSLYVVLGQQTKSPVDAQVTQIETVQSLSLSTTTGSVVVAGPAGITRADTVTYAPPGYNHIYGALAFQAAANQLDANIAVGAGTLTNPLLIVSGYTAGDPVVALGGGALVADTDYFASLRPNASELWITLNRSLTGATNRLQINISAGAPPIPAAPLATYSGGPVNVSWPAVPGAPTYHLYRKAAGGGFTLIASPTSASYNDIAISPNTSYLYSVSAASAGGNNSGFSAPSLVTTMVFADDPLVAGTTAVRAVHLAELRIAVDAVRNLAGLATGAYTDAAAADLTIKAVHVEELRPQLDQALSRLGIGTSAYTDAPLRAVIVKAVHFQEIRGRVN